MRTKPTLSVGDYVRLSEYTGEPITEIWKSRGDVALHVYDTERGKFSVNLSLLHDPCSYLTEENRCGVHDARPLACASFPIFQFMFKEEEIKQGHYDIYGCMKNAMPKPEQIELGYELWRIMLAEAKYHLDFLGGEPMYVNLPSTGNYFQLAGKACELQMSRDPLGMEKRTYMLKNSVEKMASLADEAVSGLVLDGSLYAHLLSPVMFSIMEDEIAGRLDNLDGRALEIYKKTTKRYEELARRIE